MVTSDWQKILDYNFMLINPPSSSLLIYIKNANFVLPSSNLAISIIGVCIPRL